MKMKTKSGAKKRFKLTGSGKYKHKKPNLRHILTKKASKRKRKLSQLKFVHVSNAGTMRRFFPYAQP